MLATIKQIADALNALSVDHCQGEIKCDRCNLALMMLEANEFRPVWANLLNYALHAGITDTFSLILASGIQIGAALSEAKQLHDMTKGDKNLGK